MLFRRIQALDNHVSTLRKHIRQNPLVGDRNPCGNSANGHGARLNRCQPEGQIEGRRVPLDRAVLHPPGNPDIGIGQCRLVEQKLVYGEVIHLGFLDTGIDQITDRADDEQGSYQEFALFCCHAPQLTDFRTPRKQSPCKARLI